LQIVKDLESAYNESVYFKTLEGIPIMKTKIIPVAAANEKDVITLQKNCHQIIYCHVWTIP